MFSSKKLIKHLVSVGQIVIVFDFRQCNEATKVIFCIVSIAVVLADALVKLCPLARPARVAELVEAKRSLKLIILRKLMSKFQPTKSVISKR